MYRKTAAFMGVVVVLASLLTAVGCGPKIIDVEGTVTLDGNPLGGVRVEYIPDDKTVTTGFCGTDPSGAYKIVYPGDELGVPPGTYTVTITPNEVEGETSVSIPAKYQGEASELKVTVPSADGKYDLVLTSD